MDYLNRFVKRDLLIVVTNSCCVEVKRELQTTSVGDIDDYENKLEISAEQRNQNKMYNENDNKTIAHVHEADI